METMEGSSAVLILHFNSILNTCSGQDINRDLNAILNEDKEVDRLGRKVLSNDIDRLRNRLLHRKHSPNIDIVVVVARLKVSETNQTRSQPVSHTAIDSIFAVKLVVELLV